MKEIEPLRAWFKKNWILVVVAAGIFVATAFGVAQITENIVTKRIEQTTKIVDQRINAIEEKVASSGLKIRDTAARIEREVKARGDSIKKEVSTYNSNQLIESATNLLSEFRSRSNGSN